MYMKHFTTAKCKICPTRTITTPTHTLDKAAHCALGDPSCLLGQGAADKEREICDSGPLMNRISR